VVQETIPQALQLHGVGILMDEFTSIREALENDVDNDKSRSMKLTHSEYLWYEYGDVEIMKMRLNKLKGNAERWKQRGYSGDVWKREIDYCKSKITGVKG